MLVPTRHGSSDSYRYGFNGTEKDDELKGDGNSYNFGSRIYNPRIGRFFSIDKFDSKIPFTSGYSISGNSPLYKLDENGDLEIIVHFYKKFKGKYYAAGTYKMYIKTDEDIKGITRDVMHINAYSSYDGGTSKNKSTFKGITSYAIQKDTGLNQEEQLKKDNPGVYVLGKFMQKNPLGTGSFIEAMNGKDMFTGEELDKFGNSTRIVDGLFSLITLGRAQTGGEIFKGWLTDIVFEESTKYIFSEMNVKEGDLYNKIAMYVYQTYKLKDIERGKVFETINAIYGKGLKGKELFDEILKQTNIDLTAPADKYQAAEKAVKVINSEF
jgi:RHS repeat-associated protein